MSSVFRPKLWDHIFKMLRSCHDSQVLKCVCKPIRILMVFETSPRSFSPLTCTAKNKAVTSVNVWAVSYPHLWHPNLWLALEEKVAKSSFKKSALNPIWFCYRMDERMCKWMDVLYWFLVGKFTRKCFYSMWWKRAFMVARVGHFAFTPCFAAALFSSWKMMSQKGRFLTGCSITHTNMRVRHSCC